MHKEEEETEKIIDEKKVPSKPGVRSLHIAEGKISRIDRDDESKRENIR